MDEYTVSLSNTFEADSFKDALEHMLLQGGDTDTNAAIVGGLLGAAQGMKAIPEDMVNKVL